MIFFVTGSQVTTFWRGSARPLSTNWIEMPSPAAPVSLRFPIVAVARTLKSRSLFAPAKLMDTFAWIGSIPPVRVAVVPTAISPAPVFGWPPSSGRLIENWAAACASAARSALTLAADVPVICSTPTPCVFPSPPLSAIHRSAPEFPCACDPASCVPMK